MVEPRHRRQRSKAAARTSPRQVRFIHTSQGLCDWTIPMMDRLLRCNRDGLRPFLHDARAKNVPSPKPGNDADRCRPLQPDDWPATPWRARCASHLSRRVLNQQMGSHGRSDDELYLTTVPTSVTSRPDPYDAAAAPPVARLLCACRKAKCKNPG